MSSEINAIIWTGIGTIAASVGLIYAFLRNFKADVCAKIDRLDERIDRLDEKIISIEERMFWLATGKTLKEAIIEQKNKG